MYIVDSNNTFNKLIINKINRYGLREYKPDHHNKRIIIWFEHLEKTNKGRVLREYSI
jgi:hypothetical protein